MVGYSKILFIEINNLETIRCIPKTISIKIPFIKTIEIVFLTLS